MTTAIWNDLLLSAPLLVVAAGAFLLMMLEVFLKGSWPRALTTSAVLLLSLLSLVTAAGSSDPRHVIFGGALFADAYANLCGLIIVAGALVSVIVGANKCAAEKVTDQGEYYILLLLTTAGALIFAAAAELIVLFIGLEIMSLGLYCLCGSALKEKRSIEAALKYFMLSSFSAAFLLYGMALLYGEGGSTQMPALAEALKNNQSHLFYVGMGLMLLGVIFKIGLVPFHFWVPDVYQGAPTMVTVYMATVIKAAAFGLGLRVLWTVFAYQEELWIGLIWSVAALTMVLGNLIALRQRSLKRMLAYSSIAHAGYMFMAFLAPAEVSGGAAAVFYYLVVYLFMTAGAFGVVLMISTRYAGSDTPDDITRLNGFGRTNPTLAFLMGIFMLGLAGLPPAMGGLMAKFFVFNAVVKAGYVGLVVVAVFSAAIACYYYLRVVVAMYFVESDEETVEIAYDGPLSGVVFLCALLVVGLGVFPAVLYERILAAVAGL